MKTVVLSLGSVFLLASCSNQSGPAVKSQQHDARSPAKGAKPIANTPSPPLNPPTSGIIRIARCELFEGALKQLEHHLFDATACFICEYRGPEMKVNLQLERWENGKLVATLGQDSVLRDPWKNKLSVTARDCDNEGKRTIEVKAVLIADQPSGPTVPQVETMSLKLPIPSRETKASKEATTGAGPPVSFGPISSGDYFSYIYDCTDMGSRGLSFVNGRPYFDTRPTVGSVPLWGMVFYDPQKGKPGDPAMSESMEKRVRHARAAALLIMRFPDVNR